jgi:signal transduction histidine kinase
MAFHQIRDPERLHALIDAILLIEVDADLNELLSIIVETASKLVGAHYGALGVVTADGRALSRFITYGVPEMVRTEIGPDPHGHGVLGETIRAAEPLRIDDLSTHRGFEGFPTNHPPMTRFLGVPVRTGDGHVFGNLYLCDRIDEEPFDEQDELVVEAFGRAAGLVIDQATLRSHLRELTLSEERERLARDLHDTVIQRLFGVGLALQMTMTSAMDDDVRDRINSALDELDTTIHEIRTTIFEIDREDVGDGSLTKRIELLTDEVAARLGITLDLRIAPDIDTLVGPNCAHHAVQALREMLSNVVRHSEASHATVSVEVEGNHVVLTVNDNGVGFVAPVGPGMGLRNLTSRARELGGECVVDSAPARGTLVRWTANRLD